MNVSSSVFTILSSVFVASVVGLASSQAALSKTGKADADPGRAPFYSSELGWTNGQNVTESFSALLKSTFKPRDTLVLDSFYDIDAGAALRLPRGFVLRGDDEAGFDIQNSDMSSEPTIYMGTGGTLENITFTADGAPSTGYTGLNAQRGIDFHQARAVGVIGSDNVTIVDSSFSGNIGQFISVFNSANLVVETSLFQGGRYQMMLGGDVADAYIYRNHFKNSLADGIKTIDGNIRRVKVIESLFESNLRDGIDTTGGFKDSLILNSVFYKNRSAFDIKSPIHDASDLFRPNSNSNITIQGGYIVGSPNAIVVSFRDYSGLVTEVNADAFFPHDILVKDVAFQDVGTAFLIKDGYDIRWSELVFRNVFREQVTLNINAPKGWAKLLDQNIGGTFTREKPEKLELEKLWNYE